MELTGGAQSTTHSPLQSRQQPSLSSQPHFPVTANGSQAAPSLHWKWQRQIHLGAGAWAHLHRGTRAAPASPPARANIGQTKFSAAGCQPASKKGSFQSRPASLEGRHLMHPLAPHTVTSPAGRGIRSPRLYPLGTQVPSRNAAPSSPGSQLRRVNSLLLSLPHRPLRKFGCLNLLQSTQVGLTFI